MRSVLLFPAHFLHRFFAIPLLPALLALPFALAGCHLSSSRSSGPLVVDLAADVDRNGVVDFEADSAGEDQCTLMRGAIFLYNNDSDLASGAPDCADAVVNGPNDLKDLAVLKLRLSGEMPPGSHLNLAVDAAARDRVRIFIKRPGAAQTAAGARKSSRESSSGSSGSSAAADDPAAYAPLDLAQAGNLDSVLNALPALLASAPRPAEIEMRIEALSYATPDWNGEALVTVTLDMPNLPAPMGDSVRLRVAPFLLLSNLQKGRTLYVREYPGRNDVFLSQLREIVPAAGAELYVIPGDAPYKPNHIWLQDCMEVGWSQMPGAPAGMNVVLPANRGKSLDAFPKDKLLGPDFGWFTCGTFRPEYGAGEGGDSWLDWFGNLEVTPPIPGYPLGRVYYGKSGAASLNPDVVEMLDAQGAQGPALAIDTGWLLIKHVDEVFCFVPSGNAERPYKVLIVSPGEMIALLNRWVSEGKGALPILSRYKPGTTVGSLAGDLSLVNYNMSLQRTRIEPIAVQIKREFGLADSDLIRVPAFFEHDGRALVPNMVNSAVLNGHFLVADPNGPVESGKDLLQEAFRTLSAQLPLQVHFLDDYRYHTWGGNVHCATNVRRDGFDPAYWVAQASVKSAAAAALPR